MRRARDPKHVYGPNLAPMVDVVLVILIFFMASIVFVGPEWFLPAAIPGQRTQAEQATPDPFALPDPTLNVRVSLVDGAPVVSGLGAGRVSLDDFEPHARTQLTGLDPSAIKVRLGAEAGVVWQHVVTAQDVLTRVGVRQIALDTPSR
ncbi:MAG: biopolymer transporter ExbD [Phycisphaerales bacterium]|jgi:biopolymer transport protein ExbD